MIEETKGGKRRAVAYIRTARSINSPLLAALPRDNPRRHFS